MRQLKITKQITNRTEQSLEKFLQDISKIELLTPQQEVALAVRIKAGDQAALDKMVRANLRFVVSVAKQYQHQGLSLPDLINEGNLGLIKAAMRFDETKGFKFISYAVWWIRQSILQALAEDSRIARVPLNKIGASNKVARAIQTLMQELEVDEPSNEQIAELTDFSEEEVHMLRQLSIYHVSLDAQIHEEEVLTMGELLEDTEDRPDDVVDKEYFNQQLLVAIKLTTPPKHYPIVAHFFGVDGHALMTRADLAIKYGYTIERVRQIIDISIKKTRVRFEKKLKALLQ